MKLASFRTGQLLSLNGADYEVDRIYEDGSVVLERRSDLVLSQYSLAQLSSELTNGNLVFITDIDDGLEKKYLNYITEKDQEIADYRYSYIEVLIKKQGVQPSKKVAELWLPIISKNLDDKSPPSPITAYRWWRNWYDAGKDLSALAPKPKSGRPSPYLANYKTMILDAMEEMLMRRAPYKIIAIYHYILAVINRLIGLGNKLIKPSRATFYRLVKELTDPYELMVAQQGKAVADRAFRLYGEGYRSTYILERVEIDHTPLDVFVVDEVTSEVIGRPNLTLILDHYSKMPLGFYIGFEPPSCVSVMRAMRHAILSKEYVSDKYPEIKNKWPAYGCFTTIACDNGSEFHDKQFKRMCNELNTELFFCPKGAPHFKGSVERFLGTLNRAVCHSLPGTSFGSIEERGDYDSAKFAKITLGALQENIHHWVIDIYIHSPHASLNNTPANIWSEGLKTVALTLPQSREQLDLVLTKAYARRLSHVGIRLFKLTYISPELELFRKQSAPNILVEVRLDPEDLSKVWVLDKRNKHYFSVPCTRPEYASGMSLRQHEAVLSLHNQNVNEALTPSLLQSKKEFIDNLNELSKSPSIRKRTRLAQLTQNSIQSVQIDSDDVEASDFILPPEDYEFDVEVNDE